MAKDTKSSLSPSNIKDKKDLIEFIHKSYLLKPSDIIINENKWKYLVRSVLCGKNIMMTGPAGFGKTMIAFSLAKALNRPLEVFNLGQTQDPKSYLIGNTHADKDRGTFFSQSTFVKMIQQENTIIVLDELTRAHPDAWNLLIPVLDYNQRYLRLDESEDSVCIKVAKGVSFVSTANIGSEYTATRVLDRALTDRFAIVEVDILTKDQEFGLLKLKFPDVEESILFGIAGLAHETRKEILKPSPKISAMISTRMSIETAELVDYGFSFEQAAEAMIYPHYAIETSERETVKLMLQKYIVAPKAASKSGVPLFGDDDFNKLKV